MIHFTTEFPVGSLATKRAFVAEITAWLNGTTYSHVVSAKDIEVFNDFAHLRSTNGEELRLREIHDGPADLIGFRHDYPDEIGRIWRTEGVLRTPVAGHGLVRVRTQCLAAVPGAALATPRKPYLIKALLQEGWGGADGRLSVSNLPLRLNDDDDGLTLAAAIIEGVASEFLPIVYVSTIGGDSHALSEDQISKLAYDLGGVAHVVVEPNRAFSFKLRDMASGRNVYGGAVGVSSPKAGIVRRIFLGWEIPDSRSLAELARLQAIEIRSLLPASGLDWSEMQEMALRKAREIDRDALTFDQLEKIYLEEISALKDQILQLREERLATNAQIDAGSKAASSGTSSKTIAPEVYDGEISDRLSYAARIAVDVAERVGLDPRSRYILQKVADSPRSPMLSELREGLRRASRDAKRAASELTGLLRQHGYTEKSDNKHIRLEAKPGMTGLDAITLPKTPSDKAHGLENQRKQIEKTLGITAL